MSMHIYMRGASLTRPLLYDTVRAAEIGRDHVTLPSQQYHHGLYMCLKSHKIYHYYRSVVSKVFDEMLRE